jgi:small nuclear ribonucleoprotein (snRNP)-like protein
MSDPSLDLFSPSFDAAAALAALRAVVAQREEHRRNVNHHQRRGQQQQQQQRGRAGLSGETGRSATVVVAGEWNAPAAGLPVIRAQDTLDKCRSLLPRSDPNFRPPNSSAAAALAAGAKKRRRDPDKPEVGGPTGRDDTASSRSAKRPRGEEDVGVGASQQQQQQGSRRKGPGESADTPEWERQTRAIDEARRAVVAEQLSAARKKRSKEPTPFEAILHRACPGAAETDPGGERALGPTGMLLSALRERARVCVIVRGGRDVRTVLQGELCAFDKHFNLVLSSVREFDFDWGRDTHAGTLRRSVGMLFVKGDTVVLVQRRGAR